MRDGELSHEVESQGAGQQRGSSLGVTTTRGVDAGGEQVKAAVSRLADLDSVGLDGSVQVYEDIHRALSAALEGDTRLEGNATEDRTERSSAAE